MRSSILLARKPQAGIPSFIQPRSPDAWWVTTIGEVAIASTEMHVTGVIGSCRWSTSKRSCRSTRRIAADRPGAEDDVRQRAVRRHDHGTADRDDVRRRVAVAPDPRVQRTRELARRVVAHHQPHLVPARLERLRLQLGMLDDRAPERPRERHHDADLHGGIVFTRRRPRGDSLPEAGEEAQLVLVETVEEAPVHPREVSRLLGRARDRPAVRERGVLPAPVLLAARPLDRARRTRRSTSRVSPLWLSRTADASSDIRIRPPAASLEQRAAPRISCSERPCASRSSASRVSDEGAVDAEKAAPRPELRGQLRGAGVDEDVCICNYFS